MLEILRKYQFLVPGSRFLVNCNARKLVGVEVAKVVGWWVVGVSAAGAARQVLM